MPFRSKAQRRKFAELLVKGEISPETYEEWNRETGGRKLPERLAPTRRSKTTRKGKTPKRRRKTTRKRKTAPRKKVRRKAPKRKVK